MTVREAWVVAAWVCALALAAVLAARARYIADLSAFLPRSPTPRQALLVDQLRYGPTSRLVLVALDGADAKTRAAVSVAMAHRLRDDPEFTSVNNGEEISADNDRRFIYEHRYLLSEAVTPQRFSTEGLKAALEETIADLASPEGVALKSLVPHDPTGETVQIIEQLSRTPTPPTRDGVWVSPDGARALLLAETRAAGSDTDAQERSLQAIREAFAAARRAPESAEPHGVRLTMSGPGVFAVTARANIEQAVVRLSIAGASLIAVVLLTVYRSLAALVLGLLPVATGALIGVAAVALGFPAVHGITLGFGVTLIGESVDYSIYFFIQSLRTAPPGVDAPIGASPWQERLWPTMRLGMLTSVCGFASLLPSGFPGLAQLGAYSVSGLIAAALVTRFVLPELLPRGFTIRDLKPAGEHIARLLGVLRRQRQSVLWGLALGILCAALLVLYGARGSLWNRELASLSPIPLPMQRQDAKLRGELGAPNALDLVVVSGNTLESVLQEAERAGQALEPLIDQKVIAGFDSPANYLPSIDTQAARRASLPDPERLRDDLERATAGLALDASRLRPFLDDVEAARHGPWVTAQDLKGTSLGAGFDALILRGPDGWNALLPLRTADSARPDIDDTRVESALARAHLQGTQLLDLKRESDALYTDYLHEAVRLSSAGFLAIVVLLGLALHSASRASRVLAPLVLAVLTVAAALAACRVQLTILHLVGMLLIVAVGSNYALFFDRLDRAGGADSMTLASLGVANLCTVIGFGLLSFSGVPVLEALGTTVAPGAFLALAFASVLTPRA